MESSTSFYDKQHQTGPRICLRGKEDQAKGHCCSNSGSSARQWNSSRQKRSVRGYLKKDMHAAVRAVRCFVVRNGYCRRTKKTVSMKDKHVVKRDLFLCTLIDNRNKPVEKHLREVYVEESYINHHCDLYDDYDLAENDKHKGERYCFLCTIQGPAVDPRRLPDDAGAGFQTLGGTSVQQERGTIKATITRCSRGATFLSGLLNSCAPI